ncbi:MAG: hypothetical protein ACKVHO_05705 [Verrucomicrobiia bacterium]
MSKKSKLAIGATLLFVILTTFVVLKTPLPQANEIQELEGGTRVRLLKVGYGKSHELDETQFPVKLIVGDLEFSLTNLLGGVRFPVGRRPVAEEDSYGLAQFEIREKGVLVNGWEPNLLGLHDAAGNQVHRGVAYKTMGSSEAMFVLQHLWSDAGAWKLQTTFQQKTRMLATNEIFTVRGVPLPVMDSVTELNTETELAGHRGRLVGVSFGVGIYSSFKKQRDHSSPMLDFEMHPIPGDRRLVIVSVVGESGAECHVECRYAPE